ncbi:MAG: phosphatidylglycerophosphatase A [Pseudopedobacter saltans]|uniref:Phosphatidylglycerophosphatase A n=1 Tax=Pseudopedobacter saltans TaxID=151895 RepID=A0A2W5F982_9SPHI|nr:MAG: phosphatidylglycerophosphatase A [Pseudopedobacter saltans]
MIKIIASIGGIGYIKGGGTIAAAVWSILWYVLQLHNGNITFQISSFILITILGIWTGNLVEKDWGKDSSKVVIDEVAGVGLALIGCPIKWYYVLIGLALFRFFDIVKPLGIRRMESFPKGWGVMADDLLAGLYSLIVLQILITLNFLN